MFIDRNKKLKWLLGLGFALSAMAANLASAQDYRASSQSTLQQYRRTTADIAASEGNPNYRTTAQPSSRVAPASTNTSQPTRTASRVAPAAYQGSGQIVEGGPAPVSGCTSCGTGGCGSCGSDGCGSCNDCSIRDCIDCNYFAQNGWFVGAEYLYLTEHYSEPVAAVFRTVTNTGNTSTILDETQTFDFGYNSTYRFNGGYRWGGCGETLNFSYFHYGNTADYASPIVDGTSTVVAGQLENNTTTGGQRLVSTYDMKFNNYDIDYSKRIPICSCNSNPCDCCDCPPWAITWTAGARVADLERREGSQLFTVGGAPGATSEIRTEFVGAGPKVGVEGRRYVGDNNRWSLFAKGNIALLLGDYDTVRTKVVGNTTSIQTDSYRRVIPVTEIEVGVSRQLGQKTLLTAGYFFQAWWDLGMFESMEGTNFGGEDDSNIMAFDGLMVRLERTF